MVFLKEFFKKVDFEKKNQQKTKKHEKFPRGQSVKLSLSELLAQVFTSLFLSHKSAHFSQNILFYRSKSTRGVQYVMKTAQYIPKFYIVTVHNYFH